VLELLHYAFIRNALVAGSMVAVVCGAVGFFIIARGLTFAAHALPSIGFSGAAGAVLVGVEPVYGLFAFTIMAALGMGLVGEKARERDTAIAIIMALALGLGFLFLSLYSGYAERVYAILFGSILGISAESVRVTLVAGCLSLALVLVMARPLLFSTADRQTAEARAVPVRFLSLAFLALVAVAISLSIELMGSLLVFTLIVGPPATAARLVKGPFVTVVLSSALGLVYVLVGIWIAALSQSLPVSFVVSALAFLVYMPVRLAAHPRSLREEIHTCTHC